MNFDKIKQKASEFASAHVGEYLQVVNGFDNGLMKTHEAIGFVEERVSDLLMAARHGIMLVSEKVESHSDSVTDRALNDEASKVATSSSSTDSEVVAGKIEKTVGAMTREEKIDYIIDAYGLFRTAAQMDVLRKSSDDALDNAIRIIKRRRTTGM